MTADNTFDTVHEYDAHNRLVKSIETDLSAGTFTEHYHLTDITRTYDLFGRLLKQKQFFEETGLYEYRHYDPNNSNIINKITIHDAFHRKTYEVETTGIQNFSVATYFDPNTGNRTKTCILEQRNGQTIVKETRYHHIETSCSHIATQGQHLSQAGQAITTA